MKPRDRKSLPQDKPSLKPTNLQLNQEMCGQGSASSPQEVQQLCVTRAGTAGEAQESTQNLQWFYLLQARDTGAK